MNAPYPGYAGTPGMMSEKELTWLYQTAREMTSVLEVGSWKGRSAHALLSGCQGPVYSVDHWDLDYIHRGRGPGADLQRSREVLAGARRTFLESVGQFANLKIIMLPSLQAAKAFQDDSIDMVFIDGAHSFGAVKADIQEWKPKANRILSGHDYCPKHPGVMQAVNELMGADFQTCDTIWFKELG